MTTRTDPAAGGADSERRLATIRGLLAKAEATDFPDEAEAFFAKASELISRWAIDEAMVWASAEAETRERPDELRLVIHAPYLSQKASLVGAVARAHGCTTVRLVTAGAKTETLSIVGFPSELTWVETLSTSLLVQMTSAMLAEAPTGLTSSQSASWRRSFIMGFAEAVDTRLTADRKAAAAETHRAGRTTDSSTSTALVLASREDEVRAHTQRLHPHTRSSRTSMGGSFSGRHSGRSAGRRASLSRHGIGGRRSIGRG